MFSTVTKRTNVVLTVSELTGRIRDTLESEFDNLAVIGELSNAKAHSSGHWYFSLKDKEATLACACFRNVNQSIKFQLEDGLMVVARGRISVYPPKGGYQLIVTGLDPVGVGDWQLAFEQLKAKLEKEGLLDPALKKSIPLLPRRIGVVTSPVGAALQDILNTLKRRNPHVQVVVAPAKVQGEGSAEEVAQAIADLQLLNDIDVIIVARGGGSIEDLWSFNTETVARAVAACRVPIISGVGHETDITICDLVADLRAPTPTAAAELVSAGRQQVLESWRGLHRTMMMLVEGRLLKARRDLGRLDPRHALARQEEKLKKLQLMRSSSRQRLDVAIARIIDRTKARLQNQKEKLETLGPLAILGRGFAIVRLPQGDVVTDVKQVRKGEPVEALLKAGKLTLRVEDTTDSWT